MVVKLADFGMAANIGKRNDTMQIGSTNYIAPEVLDFQAATHKSDIWSACIVIYSLCQAVLPYDGESHTIVRR